MNWGNFGSDEGDPNYIFLIDILERRMKKIQIKIAYIYMVFTIQFSAHTQLSLKMKFYVLFKASVD